MLESLVTHLGSSAALSLYGPFFVLLLCGVGLPIPEDVILITAGFLAARESISILPVCALLYIGILIGDSIIFFLGSRIGYRLLKTRFGEKLIGQSAVDRASTSLARWGSPLLFAARFMPGLRAPIYFTSGVLGFNYITFLLIDCLAALISAPVFVWIGHWGYRKFEDDFSEIEAVINHWKPYVLASALCVAVLAYLFVLMKRRLSKVPQHEEI